MNDEIIVVSGLPRSGTSLMMQMLAAGGVEVLTDGQRTADEDNPRGYVELERVKKIKQDASWLPSARGKAVKMISQLVFDLPAMEKYRLLLMERDLDEVLASQEKMLARLGRPAMPRATMKTAFSNQTDRFNAWLAVQPNFAVLRVNYVALVGESVAEIKRIQEFLGGQLHESAMLKAVDPSLYRNRKAN